MARDFRAEAIARKKLDKEADRAAAKYHAPNNEYEYIQRPPGLTDEQWRSLCEARYLILGKRTQEQRRAYLAGVEKRRGMAARQRLEEEAKQVWKSLKQ